MLSSLGGFGDKRDDEARVMMAGDWTTNSNLGRNGVRKCVCSVKDGCVEDQERISKTVYLFKSS